MEEIYKKLFQILGTENHHPDKKKVILEGLNELEKKIKKFKNQKKRNTRKINEILDVVISMASLEYGRKATVSPKKDYFDALASGINMLGEELQSSTISLREKEVLLKEIHHRVKNNLQIISSLLSLQSQKISDPAMQAEFLETRNRIWAMGLVHEKLYETNDFSRIDMGKYLYSFLDYIKGSFNINPARIKLNVDIRLNMPYFKIDTAIPCGLILNEIVSNSCKHAFPKDKNGKIHLTFREEENADKGLFYIMEVADDGIGLPQNFNIKELNSLGLQLVEILTEQLDGELNYDGTAGTKFTIRFPDPVIN